MIRKCFIVLLLMVCVTLLVGCSPGVSGTENPTASSTAPVVQSEEPTVPMISTLTPEINPTPLAVTETPVKVTIASAPPDLLTFERQVNQERSPDGKYSARILTAYPPLAVDGSRAGDRFYTRVWLHETTSGRTVEIEEDWQDIGLGNTFPAVAGWSGDGTKLFLVDRGAPDGCGPIFNENLRTYDIFDGTVTQHNISHSGLISVTPDGKQALIFAPGEIQLIDLESLTEAIIPFEAPTDEYWLVDPVWSPDGNSLLFGALTNPCVSYEAQETWLYLVRVLTGEVSVLQQDEPANILPVSWPISGLAQLRGRDGQDWWLDVPAESINSVPPANIANARSALFSFFTALNQQNFSDAPRYYGGAYDVLSDINPDVAAEDKISLWENACTVNGYACLPIYQSTLINQPAPDQLVFRVTFSVDEGHIFEFGPCCGADITDMPPAFEFDYLVHRDSSGTWLVMDTPQYVP